MPITIRHDAAAGLVGAYGAGQAAGRRRGQKYILDDLAQRRRHQQRMEERFGPRGGLRGGRRGAEPEGVWLPPAPMMEEGGFEGVLPSRTVEGRAKIKANARAIRLGKPPPYPEVMPRWKSRAEIEREGELADEARDRERALEDEAREFERKKAAAEADREHDFAMEEWKRRTAAADERYEDVNEALDEGLYPEDVAERLRDLISDYTATARSRTIEPEKRAELLDDINGEIDALRDKRTTLEDRYNKGVKYYDPTTGKVSPDFREGTTPVRIGKDGELEIVELPETPSDRRAAEEREKKEEAEKTRIANRTKFYNDMLKMFVDRMTDATYKGTKHASIEEAVQAANEQATAAYGPPVWAPTRTSSGDESAPDTATSGAEAAERIYDHTKPLPEGMPKESRPVWDPNAPLPEGTPKLNKPVWDPNAPLPEGTPTERLQGAGMRGSERPPLSSGPAPGGDGVATPPAAQPKPPATEPTELLRGRDKEELPSYIQPPMPGRESFEMAADEDIRPATQPGGKAKQPSAEEELEDFAQNYPQSAKVLKDKVGKDPSKMTPQELEQAKVALAEYREYKYRLQQEQLEQARAEQQQFEWPVFSGGFIYGGQ